MNNSFSWPVRVYYEDTDGGGVVYHANYLRFMERARTEWLRHLGHEQDALRSEEGLLFVVRSCDIQFLSPALFNDELIVTAKLAEHRRASIVLEQRVLRGETVLCQAKVAVVCVDEATFKPKKIPSHMFEKMTVATS